MLGLFCKIIQNSRDSQQIKAKATYEDTIVDAFDGLIYLGNFGVRKLLERLSFEIFSETGFF